MHYNQQVSLRSVTATYNSYLSELDIEDNCIYDYEFVFDFDDSMCSHGIALKADNGKYLEVPNIYTKFIVATSDSPVYFAYLIDKF